MKFKEYQRCWMISDYWNSSGELIFSTEPVIIVKVPKSEYGSILVLRRCGYNKLRIDSVCKSVLFETEEDAIKRADLLANNGTIN